MENTDPLHQALRALPEHGPGRLEVLAVALFERWTGQRFYLSQSGSQSGRDLATSGASANWVAVEAKRYQRNTRIDTREILGEIVQATNRDPGLDLWVLFITRPVSEQDENEILKAGEKCGVGTLILDAEEHTGPSRVSTLCARFPDITLTHCAAYQKAIGEDDLRLSMEGTQQDPGFGSSVREMEGALTGANRGYEAAREEASSWLTSQLADDQDSKREFGQSLGINDPNRARPIQRITIRKDLDQWWAKWPENPICLLQGEEGMGKTWCALSWITHRMEIDAEWPLTVVFTHNRLREDPSTLEGLCANAIQGIAGSGTHEMWSRRIRGWLTRTDTMVPLVLIVLDGLNERPQIDWVSLLRQIHSPQWNGHVAILATSRTAFWESHLADRLGDYTRRAPVGGYSDGELRQAFGAFKLTPDEIPPPMQEFVRKPRYCDLVCRHFHSFRDSGDLTVERLIYEDWKDRRGRKDNVQLTDSGFRQILGETVERVRGGAAGFRENEIRQMLPSDSQATVLQDLLTSGIFENDPESSRPLRVNRRLLVHGLGMLLAETLRDSGLADENAAADELDRWLEPHSGIDLKTAIVGAAVFFSTVSSGYPTGARKALLRRWIGSQNMDQDGQDHVLAYFLKLPAEYLEFAESLWINEAPVGAAQDRLVHAFKTHRDHPSVLPHLKETFNRWMGMVSLRGRPEYESERWEMVEHTRRTLTEMLGHSPDPGEIIYLEITLIVGRQPSVLRLANLVLDVIGSGSRKPFLEALLAWSVSRSIMGIAFESEEVSWTLRLTDEDIDSALVPRLRELLLSELPIAHGAVRYLSSCMGTVRALEVQRALPGQPARKSIFRGPDDDPCKQIWRWDRGQCEPCSQRPDISVDRIVSNLHFYAADPTLELPLRFVERLREYACGFDTTQLEASRSRTKASGDLAEAEPILAAFLPHLVSDMMREMVRTLQTRKGDARLFLAARIDKWALLLRAEERACIEATWLELLDEMSTRETGGVIAGNDLLAFAEERLFLVLLSGAPGHDQLRMLLGRPATCHDVEEFEDWFGRLNPQELKQAIAELNSDDNCRLRRVLWYLGHQAFTPADKERQRLLELAGSSDANVRIAVLEMLGRTDNASVALEISPPICVTPTTSPGPERAWTNHILLECSKEPSRTDLWGRIGPEALGDAVLWRGCSEEEVRLYGGSLHQWWLRTMRVSTVSTPVQEEAKLLELPGRVGLRLSKDILVRVIGILPELAKVWTDTLITPPANPIHRLYDLSEFYRPLCSALFVTEAALALKLWNFLWRFRLSDPPPKSRNFDQSLVTVAFDSPEGPEAELVRKAVLVDADSDFALYQVAWTALRYGKINWLERETVRLVRADPLWRRAVGLSLASLSDVEEAKFRDLHKDARIESTWVSTVWKTIEERFSHNRWARHWYRRFLEAPDDDEAWCALRLLSHCIDGRFRLWKDQIESEATSPSGSDPARRTRFLKMEMDRLEKEIEKREDAMKETFVGLKRPLHSPAPYRAETESLGSG